MVKDESGNGKGSGKGKSIICFQKKMIHSFLI